LAWLSFKDDKIRTNIEPHLKTRHPEEYQQLSTMETEQKKGKAKKQKQQQQKQNNNNHTL